MGKRVGKILITSLLVISLLSCSFSVYAEYVPVESDEQTFNEWYVQYASEYPDADSAWKALGVYGIWAIMNACGVSISVDGVYEWSDAMYFAIEEMYLRFLAESLHISWLHWTLEWAFSFTDSGLFQGNSTMVEDVEDFISWIRGEYNLQDNSTSGIDTYLAIPVYNEQAQPVYFPTYMLSGDSNSWTVVTYDSNNFFDYYNGFKLNVVYRLTNYWFRIIDDPVTMSLRMQFAYDSEFSNIVYSYVIASSSRNHIYNEYNLEDAYNGVIEFPVFYNQNAPLDNYKIRFVYAAEWNGRAGFTTTYTIAMSYTTFANYFYPQQMGVVANTATITVPSDDPNYTDGDMIVIDDGTPIYLSVEFPDSISVNNLPAIVSTGEITDPEIDQIYTNIPALVDEAGDSMEIFRQIIFRMPDGVLIALYGLLSAGVIFGFLRIMREH